MIQIQIDSDYFTLIFYVKCRSSLDHLSKPRLVIIFLHTSILLEKRWKVHGEKS